MTTREPGDLPERGHPSDVRWARAGRTSAAVTKRFVTRMEAAMAVLARILSIKFTKTVRSRRFSGFGYSPCRHPSPK